MKLTHLQHVVAAAETGSLRAAARDLGIPQPSITRSIREVEQELGVPLFERHQQGVRLTAMGSVFLKRAVAVQSELRRAKEEINQLSGQITGEVSVAMSAVSSIALMPRAVRGFRSRYPQANLKITEAYFHSVEAQILAGQIDFCVGPFGDAAPASRYLVEGLFDHHWMVIARKGHPLAGCSTLAELTGAEWVRPTLSDRSTEAHIAQPFLSQGLGAPIDRSLFNVLELEETMQGTRICLIHRTDMPLTPLAEYFADMIRRAALAVSGTDI